MPKKFTYKDAEEIIKERYSISHNGDTIDFSFPRTYTEKMNFSKLYNASNIKRDLTDKIKVRDWIKKKIGKEYLIPVLGIYDSFDEIDFDSLPEKYVIKCNHDSGSTIVVDENCKYTREEMKEKYDYFMQRNLAAFNYEMHYRDIVPKIMIEAKIGENIKDYKFICFDGEPCMCWVDVNRFIKHQRIMYDLDWQKLPMEKMTYPKYEGEVEKPKKFDQMLKIVKKLAKGFDQVRVDLYEDGDNIYFGEMTFTSENGMTVFEPELFDVKLGHMWKLDTRNREKLLNEELVVERQPIK